MNCLNSLLIKNKTTTKIEDRIRLGFRQKVSNKIVPNSKLVAKLVIKL